MNQTPKGLTHLGIKRDSLGGITRDTSAQVLSPLKPLGTPARVRDSDPTPPPPAVLATIAEATRTGGGEVPTPKPDTSKLTKADLAVKPIASHKDTKAPVSAKEMPKVEGKKVWRNQYGVGYSDTNSSHGRRAEGCVPGGRHDGKGPERGGEGMGGPSHGRTPGIRRALKALAKKKRANKKRIAKGQKPIIAGKKVTAKQFAAKTSTTVAAVKKTIKRQRKKR